MSGRKKSKSKKTPNNSSELLKRGDSNGRFVKGSVPNPNGRPKGSKNKSPARIVDKIIEIDEQLELEGNGLLDCARLNPKWFYEKIFIKVLPKNIDLGTESSPIEFTLIDSYALPPEEGNPS